MMTLLVRALPHRLEPDAAETGTRYDERKLSVHLQNAATFIRRNSAEPINLEQVAAANSVSAGYLSRLFRNETGGSFSNFVTQVRLLRSLDLLSASQPPKILSIALECGFPNVKSFNLAFRRAFDCVPTEWPPPAGRAAARPSLPADGRNRGHRDPPELGKRLG